MKGYAIIVLLSIIMLAGCSNSKSTGLQVYNSTSLDRQNTATYGSMRISDDSSDDEALMILELVEGTMELSDTEVQTDGK